MEFCYNLGVYGNTWFWRASSRLMHFLSDACLEVKSNPIERSHLVESETFSKSEKVIT